LFNIKKNGERLNEIALRRVEEKAEKKINSIDINMHIQNMNNQLNFNQNNIRINEELEIEGN